MHVKQALLREIYAIDQHRLSLDRESRELVKRRDALFGPIAEMFCIDAKLPDVEPGILSLEVKAGRANVSWKDIVIAELGEDYAEKAQKEAKLAAKPSLVIVDTVQEKREAFWQEKGKQSA